MTSNDEQLELREWQKKWKVFLATTSVVGGLAGLFIGASMERTPDDLHGLFGLFLGPMILVTVLRPVFFNKFGRPPATAPKSN